MKKETERQTGHGVLRVRTSDSERLRNGNQKPIGYPPWYLETCHPPLFDPHKGGSQNVDVLEVPTTSEPTEEKVPRSRIFQPL